MDRQPELARFSFLKSEPPPTLSLRRTALLISFGALLFSIVAFNIWQAQGVPKDAGWRAETSARGYFVTDTQDGSAASKLLHPADRILALNGQPFASLQSPRLMVERVPLGNIYSLTVLRSGKEQIVKLPMEPDRDFGPVDRFMLPLSGLLLFLLGAWMALSRPRDITARLAAATFLSAALVMLSPVLLSFPGQSPALISTSILLASIWWPWHLPLTYDFLSRFPHPVREGSFSRSLRAGFYFAAALLWAPLFISVLSAAFGVALPNSLAWASALLPHGTIGAPAFVALQLAFGLAMCLILPRNYLRLSDPMARLRIRWAALGLGCGIVPFAVVAFLRSLLDLTGDSALRPVLGFASDAGTILVTVAPLIIVYAVMKHRVFGIHVAIRRGVQYLLAKNVLRFLVILPLLLVVAAALRHPDRSLEGLLFHGSRTFYLGLACTAILSLRYRRPLRHWLDRRFFRLDYERDRTLVDLAERVKTVESEEELATVVAREIDISLGVDNLHILLRTPRTGFKVAFSRPLEAGLQIREFLQQGERSEATRFEPVSFYEWRRESAENPASDEPAAPPLHREFLTFPLIGTEGVEIGLLVLGPKRSEEPYSSKDRHLLRAVANQVAVMYEVIRLKQRVASDARERTAVWGRLQQSGFEVLHECPRCGECYPAAQQECPVDGEPLSASLPVERLIDAKYRLDRRIGSGGMGVVYRAVDLDLERDVAIKIMIGDSFGDWKALQRFEREAKTAAGLRHPNIIGVHDFGRLPHGGAYLVMELIHGFSWRDALRSQGLIPPSRATHWLRQLCAATHSAHTFGVVHRDLKPENIMIAEENGVERAVILDFGLAKLRDEFTPAAIGVTTVGVAVGTRSYMSPEQRLALPVDHRTDVFSVGVIAIETLTGVAPPRTGASVEWTLDALGCVTAGADRLRDILTRAVAPDPADRIASTERLGAELCPALQQVTVTPRVRIAGEDDLTGLRCEARTQTG